MVQVGNLTTNSVGGGGVEIQRGVDGSYAWKSMARKEGVGGGDPEQYMTTHHRGNITRDATVNNVTERRNLATTQTILHANEDTS